METQIQDITFYQDSSLKVNRQDYVKKHSDMQIHDHEFLTVSLLLSGSLIEHTSEGTKIINPGDVLIKPPSLMHGDLFTENCSVLSFKIYDWDYYNFNYGNWEILPKSGLIKHFLKVVNTNNKKQSLSDLENAIALSVNNGSILRKIPDRIKHVRTLIDMQFLEPIQIADLAKEVNLNPVYIGQAFKDYYNIDIKSYQQQLRTHFAISKMFSENDNFTQIAYTAGYADQSHFSREFKKSTNFSPKKFSYLLDL